MSIQEQLINRLHKAMRDKNIFERDYIRVILAEFSRKSKILSDREAIEELVKMKANSKIVNSDESIKECNFLDNYIPCEFDEAEISEILSTLIDELDLERSIKNMGALINEFKATYPGQNGAIVAKLAKKLLV